MENEILLRGLLNSCQSTMEEAAKLAATLMDASVAQLCQNLEKQLFRNKKLVHSPIHIRLQAMEMRDIADHMEIAHLLREDHNPAIVAAVKLANRLETVSRDKMPAEVWRFLQRCHHVLQQD